ncbi:hypothetical protein ACXN5S_18660 [Pseudoroseicyclus sp. H15]
MAQRIKQLITRADESWLGEAAGAVSLFAILFAALTLGGVS